MKRIILMVFAVLLCVTASAQKFIESDTTEDGIRTIKTKACSIITNDLDVLVMSFWCNISEQRTSYIPIIMFYNSQPCSVEKSNLARVEMIDGESVYMTPLVDSWYKPYNNQYLVTAIYRIAEDDIHNMLAAINKIKINFEQNGITTSKEYRIPFSSAKELMESYLDLLIYTGN